jgi:bifunctional enzyme Fae/Hps
MSGIDAKKPATREALIKILTEAAQKEAYAKGKPTKPTISGTAKTLNIHRDTVYTWMKEFKVDFKEVLDNMPQNNANNSSSNYESVYLIGESLVGEGNEVAHVDLLIGDKKGPIGQAFATGMANLSAGHTPLLAVIRPNLPPKPATLIVPKVTVKNMADTSKIFGPAQAAVAKAVADAVEEGIIPADKIEDWVIIASVFIHPQATDFRRIYQYNYGATKMAIQRAIKKYPSLDKINYDKDRGKHPIMGFKVPRLWRPPYLQIALDAPSLEGAKQVLEQLPGSDRIIVEVGTPLINR